MIRSVITERQAGLLRALRSTPVGLWQIGERNGIKVERLAFRMAPEADLDAARASAIRRFERACRRLLPHLRKLERRGFLEIGPLGTRSLRFSETVRGRAALQLHDALHHPEAVDRSWHGAQNAIDSAARTLGLLDPEPLPAPGDPGDLAWIVDRIDDVVPTSRLEEPWADTHQWWHVHWWVEYFWQIEKPGQVRGAREMTRGWDRERGEYIEVPTSLAKNTASRAVAQAAERVYRATGCRRVAIHRCLPPHELEFVGVAAPRDQT